jgi:hypothetical protein
VGRTVQSALALAVDQKQEPYSTPATMNFVENEWHVPVEQNGFMVGEHMCSQIDVPFEKFTQVSCDSHAAGLLAHEPPAATVPAGRHSRMSRAVPMELKA